MIMSEYYDRLRVLVVEKDPDFCRMFVDVMNRVCPFGIDVISENEKLREYVSECYFNVIVANKKYISASDIEYIFSHNVNPEKYPFGTEIILIGDEIYNDRMYRIGDTKPMFYLKKPLDCDFLKSIILLINHCQSLKYDLMIAQAKPQNLDSCIKQLLKGLGVPSNMKGHGYLVSAIRAATLKPDMLEYITKLLYPSVAKIHHTPPTTIERGIRHVIEVAWDRGDVDMFAEIFGYTIDRMRGKPTNSEFIAMVSEYIRLNNPELLYGEELEEYAEIIG